VVLVTACPALSQEGGAGGHAPVPAVQAPSVLPEAAPKSQRKAIPLGMTPEGLAAKERARHGGEVGTDKATATPDAPPRGMTPESQSSSPPAKGGR